VKAVARAEERECVVEIEARRQQDGGPLFLRGRGGRQAARGVLQFSTAIIYRRRPTSAHDARRPTSRPSAEKAMLTSVMQDAINDQVNNELFSSYSYLAMSAWCEHQQFTGCARWLRLQSQEEYAHAMKLYDFLLARNAKVKLKPIAAPEHEFNSVANVFDRTLEQEIRVTGQIDSLYELAFQEKQFAALVELEWFITEQVEEEKTAREIVKKFHLVKDDPASLLDLDRELGGRTAAEATA
jgi:ferritin